MGLSAALLAIVLLAACGGGGGGGTSTGTATVAAGQAGRVAKNGDKVAIHYTGTLDDGTEFDSSKGREPLTFTLGTRAVIAGFERAVTGLEVGKSRKVHIEPKDAYGERREDLVVSIPAAEAPAGLQVGQVVPLQNGARAKVVAVTLQTVTIDANHELAGKALNFDIQLVSIN